VEQWRNDTDGETKVYGEKPVPLPLSSMNSTCQGSNPGPHSDRLVYDKLSLVTATVEYCKILIIIRNFYHSSGPQIFKISRIFHWILGPRSVK